MNDERKLIFIVDDSDSSLVLGKNALSDLYRVITFDSGSRMLKVLENAAPDLLILDMEMPEMSGHDVIVLLKASPRTSDIPVIFLTSSIDEETEIRSFDLGAHDFISKPLSPPRLRRRVQTALQLEAQKQALVNYSQNLEQLVEQRTQSVSKLKNTLLNTIASLVEFRDCFTGSHIWRTQSYIAALFDAMERQNTYMEELSQIDQVLALYSSQLHDVGKIGIKDAILLKPGKLNQKEFEEMKTHTILGSQIIKQIRDKASDDNSFLEYAMIYALYHHEKWNGTGYPFGFKNQDIPLLGRIMSIADVYDALVTERPYKKAFPHSEAVEIIVNGSGRAFDPLLIDCFNGIHQEFEIILNTFKEPPPGY